jgi:CheY-like chemotaxis protein
MSPGMNARPVLLIDDDPDWGARVGRFLEPHGISVLVHRTLDTALQHIAQHGEPAALVMDIATRADNGPAIAAMRQEPALQSVPVGYVKKSAALDALLLMVAPGAASAHHAA